MLLLTQIIIPAHPQYYPCPPTSHSFLKHPAPHICLSVHPFVSWSVKFYFCFFLYFCGLLSLLLPKCSSALKHSPSPPSREKPCIQFWPTRCTGLVTLRYKWVGAMICDDLWTFALEEIVDDKRKMRDWPLGPTITSIHPCMIHYCFKRDITFWTHPGFS